MNAKTTALFAEQAYLEGAMARDVAIEIAADGTIESVKAGSVPGPGSEQLTGLVVPGMPNVHSHAFQRAMAGLAERAGPAGDTFWSWREVMYRFLMALTPEDVEAIAAQLYAELLTFGFTTVGEFHYLHNAPDGSAYTDRAELAHRILAARKTSGIGLTLLPVLYQTSDFGGKPPSEGQRRFVLPTDDFHRVLDGLKQATANDPTVTLGVAPHSLRAVTVEALRAAMAMADEIGPQSPVHIHAAEQVKEVRDCVEWSGARPVEWLLEMTKADERWCLIHATHLSETERLGLARSGSVAGLCPTTEANLGDGFFAFSDVMAAGGRFGIGTDSHVGVNPAEELRLIEYAGRLQTRTRNIGASGVGISIGAALYDTALAGGAQACGRAIGRLAKGHRADLVVLDTDHPALAGREGPQLFDAWIFCNAGNPVREVYAGGRKVVSEGRHVAAEPIAENYRTTMRRLMAVA